MDKIISWFIIMFIGLVPLGAFFDTKQPLKPNMEQFFMKRQKRAINPTQCGDSCELEFSSIKNSGLVIIPSVDTGLFCLILPKVIFYYLIFHYHKNNFICIVQNLLIFITKMVFIKK